MAAKIQGASAPAVFNFVSNTLRVVMRDGEPWFVAADVIAALALDRKALERLDDDEKGVNSIHTPGGDQEMTIINESGLYSLILGSRKPEAKKFKKWVTSEVLPAIRKTGRYVAPRPPQLVRLGEVGEWVVRQHNQHAARYLCRSGQSLAATLSTGIKYRFGSHIRDLPVATLPELLDHLDQFGDDCYRLWAVCMNLERALVDTFKGQPDAMPSEVKTMMAAVHVPSGEGTSPQAIRQQVQAMIAA